MRREDWESHIEAQQQGGLTVAEYCRTHGLAVSTFQYQKQRQSSRFVALTGEASGQCELSFGDGTVLRFPASAVSSVLNALLER